jgi:predicted dinucleotide-binding enzyme
VTAEPRSDEPGVIGIIGAGRAGLAVARRALDAGYTVKVATAGPIGTTAPLVSAAAPGAVVVTTPEVADDADLLVLAVPLHRFRELPLPLFASHVVIDMMNYWPPVDGVLPGFEGSARPSSVLVAEALPAGALLVKAVNHFSYRQLEELARPIGAPDRVGLAISGDDPDAVEVVSAVVDRLGFDPVPAGDLNASAVLQPGSSLFGSILDGAAMRRLLDATRIAAA